MSLESDVLVDRRRLQRKISIWRTGAILFAIGLVLALLASREEFSEFLGTSSQIARIKITGVITDDKQQQKMLEKLAKADHVKAVIMHVNSPGGTTTGGEALYASIRRISDKKPIVAVFGTVAASAAYIAGIGSDHIVSRGNTVTGSIGVIFQFANVSDLLDKIGVKVEEIKSGPLKASPSPFQPIDDKGRQLAREIVMDAQNWFLGLVEERRKLTPLQMQGLKDGRIFSGRQALKQGLIDQIGGEGDAIRWLADKKKIDAALPVKDWRPERDANYPWLTKLAAHIEEKLGLPRGILSPISKNDSPLERLRLDGLISIWQPISKG